MGGEFSFSFAIAHVEMRHFFLERDISDLNFGFFRYLVHLPPFQ